MENTLQSSWNRCWKGLKAHGDGLALMRKLVAAYGEPQRKYHTAQHLAECLALLERYRDLAVEPEEVEMALWFHDAVYGFKSGDNEVRSAEWAETELQRAWVAPERIERVKQLILATRHGAVPQGQDQELMLDIDLSIFGAPRQRFEEYEEQVRVEFSWVPEPLFRHKRRSILAGFLARQSIYHTPGLHQAFEQQARENLACALDNLQG